MDRIAETSALARRIKATRADAYTMKDYPRKRAALSWLDMASLILATEEEGSIEQAEHDLISAQRIITGTDTQKELPTMPAKTQPETAVTVDPMAAIAQMMANQTAMMTALMEKVSTPTSATPAKPKNALPEESKPTAKALTVTLAANRATASTVVYSVADHSVLWADRGLSLDRKALESIGNPQSITVTITAK